MTPLAKRVWPRVIAMAIKADSDSDSDRYLSEELGSLAEVWKRMREGWWNEAGYETFWDYFKAQEKSRARMGLQSVYAKRRKRPKTRELPDTAPPEIDLDDLAADATRPRASRGHQVNVRLTQLGHDALTEAARVYGLRPTTLARLLIHRGALAVIEAQRGDQERDA
jgi:hypothetical protein